MKRSMIVAIVTLMCGTAFAAGQYQGQYSVNPYSSGIRTQPPPANTRLYNDQGEYRGKLNSNRYDPESTSNEYGRYGSRYSSDSINNPYGAGSRYRHDSPNNPYGRGLRMYTDE